MKSYRKLERALLVLSIITSVYLTQYVIVNYKPKNVNTTRLIFKSLEQHQKKVSKTTTVIKSKHTFSQPWVFMAGPHYLWKLSRWLDYIQIIDLDNGNKIYANLIHYKPKLIGIWQALSCLGLPNGNACVENVDGIADVFEFNHYGKLIYKLSNYDNVKIPYYINGKLYDHRDNFGLTSGACTRRASLLGVYKSKIFIMLYHWSTGSYLDDQPSILITDLKLRPLERRCYLKDNQYVLRHYIPVYPWLN